MPPSADQEVDPRILRALRNRLRQEIMRSLAETPSSVNELAEELGYPPSRVRRHMRVLVENDAVETVDGEEVGADDRRFRIMVRPFLDDAHFAQLPADRRQILCALTVRDIARRVDDAMERGGFRHEQTHVSLTRLLLDDQGWQEVVDVLAGVLEEVMMIEAESADRHGREGGQELHGSTLAILHFDRPERGASA